MYKCNLLKMFSISIFTYLFLGSLHAMAVEDLTADKMLDFTRMTPKHREALLNGEILVIDTGTEATEDLTPSDLYSGLATFVHEPFKTAVAALQDSSTKNLNDKTITHLYPANPFPNIDFKVADSKEIERMLRFSKGRDINLSSVEVSILKNLGISAPIDSAELGVFTKAYQRILEKRFQSYTQKGLAGIEPYTRGKRKSQSVSEHLQAVTNMFCKQTERFVPDYCEDLLQYPKVTDRAQQYLLVYENWENRPLYSLIHRMADISEKYAFFMHREYFVGHSYDAMQANFLLVPYKGGTLIGMETDVITDKAAGIGMNYRHKVGRDKIRSVAESRLTDIKKLIKNFNK